MDYRDVAMTCFGRFALNNYFLRFEREPPRRWEAKGRFLALGREVR